MCLDLRVFWYLCWKTLRISFLYIYTWPLLEDQWVWSISGNTSVHVCFSWFWDVDLKGIRVNMTECCCIRDKLSTQVSSALTSLNEALFELLSISWWFQCLVESHSLSKLPENCHLSSIWQTYFILWITTILIVNWNFVILKFMLF